MMHEDSVGPYGRVSRFPDDQVHAQAPATLAGWLITAPGYHPLWSQYMLAVITLADIEGIPAAHKESPDSTHELMVMAVNPERGPYDADTFLDKAKGASPFLSPTNIAQQFSVETDEQAVEIAWLCAQAVIHGQLNPETGDAPSAIRAHWKESIRQTVDHLKDPHHGKMN